MNHDRLQKIMMDFVLSIFGGEQAFNLPYGWAVNCEKSGQRIEAPDVLETLGYWAKAGHLEMLLSENPSELLEQTYPLVQNEGTYEELLTRFHTLTGSIHGLDETDKELWESEINVQLMKELGAWSNKLETMTRDNFNPEYDDEDNLFEFSNRRDMLEYIHMGIEAQQAKPPHFSGVTKLEEYQKGLVDSDRFLRRLFGKNRELVDYADKTFWWRHPAPMK